MSVTDLGRTPNRRSARMLPAYGLLQLQYWLQFASVHLATDVSEVARNCWLERLRTFTDSYSRNLKSSEGNTSGSSNLPASADVSRGNASKSVFATPCGNHLDGAGFPQLNRLCVRGACTPASSRVDAAPVRVPAEHGKCGVVGSAPVWRLRPNR